MQKNYDVEIDEIQKELHELKELFYSFMQQKNDVEISNSNKQESNIHIMKNMHPDKRLSEKMEELCKKTEKKNITGMISYLGVYSSGGRQSNWIRNEVCTDDLLELIENNIAEKILTCIGNNNRLNILLALLKKPMSVIEIVNECSLNTTGQAYHHMKPLLSANLITEDTKSNNKGTYIVQPNKVQGIIMLLAGICDMVGTSSSF